MRPPIASPTTVTELETMAAQLCGVLGAHDESALAVSLLRLLARGEPVAIGTLAERVGRRTGEVAAWRDRSATVERDAEGRVTAFSGLTLEPTAHRFTVDDVELHTWCAFDTLFLPELLDRPARVESTCPATARPVRLTVTPDDVRELDPADAVVSMVSPGGCSDVRATFCCHVTFFATQKAAAAWHADHPGGHVLSVIDAHRLAKVTNERCLNPDA